MKSAKLIEHFHEPLLKNPLSNKGSGMAIDVNKRVVDDQDKMVPFNPNHDLKIKMENIRNTMSDNIATVDISDY